MQTKEIATYLEDWAPPKIAWEKDNVGLQTGSLQRDITNILLSLDVTEKVVAEAVRKNCNLIISHHPLLFFPLKKVDVDHDEISRIVASLIKHDITLLSHHTNLDFTGDGVSITMAKLLGLQEIDFLTKLSANQSKIVVFVPKDDLTAVSEAIFNAGGGIIGDYTHCSYRLNGEGTFFGTESTNPQAGEKGRLETVEEVRLEVIADNWKTGKIISAMLKAHSYEEPAYDVYPLNNTNQSYGVGAIGVLPEALTEDECIRLTAKTFQAAGLRYAKGKGEKIRKVAMVGGGGMRSLNDAIRAGADAFISADGDYHSFQQAEGKILLIDAGHYETEAPVLKTVETRLRNFIQEKGAAIEIYRSSEITNPITFYTEQGAT